MTDKNKIDAQPKAVGFEPLVSLGNGEQYRYRLTSTGQSSVQLGVCEVCGKAPSEVFLQTEEKHYSFYYENINYEGWVEHSSLFGHRDCLLNRRKQAILSK